MIRRYGYLIIACISLSSLIACSDSATTPTATAVTTTTTTSTAPTGLTIGITPAAGGLAGTTELTAIGEATQLRADALFSVGQQDVTSQTTWQSSNAAIATVSASGVVTAVGPGQATITATYQSVTGTTTVVVTLNLAATLNLTGTWSGTGTDSLGASQFTATLTQSGGPTVFALSGPVTFVSDGFAGTGTFMGIVTIDNPLVPFVINGAQSLVNSSCSFTVSGNAQASSSTLTSSYAGTSCFGQITTGQVTLTAQ